MLLTLLEFGGNLRIAKRAKQKVVEKAQNLFSSTKYESTLYISHCANVVIHSKSLASCFMFQLIALIENKVEEYSSNSIKKYLGSEVWNTFSIIQIYF